MTNNIRYLHRQQRPDLFAQLAANDRGNDVVESDSDPVWRAAAFGALLGFYAGMMVTAGLAYVWHLFL